MRRIKLLLFVFIPALFFCIPAFGQEAEGLFSNEKFNNIISESGAGARKIQKATKVKQKGDLVQAKADVYQVEIDDIQQNSRRMRKKKIARLEKKALTKKIEASVYYQQAHKIKYKLYKKYLKKLQPFAEDNETDRDQVRQFEKEARIHYNKAKRWRRKASNKEDKTKKFGFLSDAYDLEILAFQKQENAFEIYQTNMGQEVLSTDVQPIEHDTIQEILPDTLQESEYDTIQEIILPEEPEEDSLQFADTIDYPSLDTLSHGEEIIEDTVFNQITFFEEPVEIESEVDSNLVEELPDSIHIIEIPADTTGVNRYTEEEIRRIDSLLSVHPQIIRDLPPDIEEDKEVIAEELQVEKEKDIVEEIIPGPSKVIFYVQVLATKLTLNQSQIDELYKGTHKVRLVNEGGLNKYQVGEFDNFESVVQFKKNSGLDEGFVVAYKNGKKISLQEARELTKDK